VLWYLAFIAMAAMSVRNIALFVLPAGFMLAVHGGDWLRRAGELWPKARRLMVPATCVLLAGAAALGGLAATEAYYRWLHRREIRFGLGLSYGVQPVELAKYLGSLDVEGDILPLDFGEGGTYICYSWPRHKVWMDGRLEVHSLQRFDQLYEIRTKMRREDQAGDPAITPLPPSVRFITVRSSDSVRLQALAKCPRFQLLYVDPASVCFARIPQPGEQVTWSAKDKLPAGNLDELEGSFPGGVIKPLLGQYQPQTWLRQNATEWHYIYGNMFSCLGLDRLAVRYLTAAMQLEDWVNPLDVRGQLAQSYQRICESQQLQLDLDLPIDPYLSRALALYNDMHLADLDSEQAQAYALVQIRSYILGGQIDAGDKAMTDYLDRLPIPSRWTPPSTAEDIRNQLQVAHRRAIQSLEALRRQLDDFRGLDPAMKAHLLLGKNLGLIDQAISVLSEGQVSMTGKMLLGDLYLRKGQVALARKAYAAANPPAQDFRTRSGLCDWAEGDFASAVKNLNEAAKAEGDSPLPTLYLGLLQEQLGDNPAAATALNAYNCADPGRLSSNLVGLLRQMAARQKMAGQDVRLNLPSSMLQER
jgi:tetratricopeptide (TPR) repeat protein